MNRSGLFGCYSAIRSYGNSVVSGESLTNVIRTKTLGTASSPLAVELSLRVSDFAKFVEQGGDVNEKVLGKSILFHVTKHPDHKTDLVLNHLLGLGARFASEDFSNGNGPIHHVINKHAHTNYEEVGKVVQVLQNAGYDINQRNNSGETPLGLVGRIQIYGDGECGLKELLEKELKKLGANY